MTLPRRDATAERVLRYVVSVGVHTGISPAVVRAQLEEALLLFRELGDIGDLAAIVLGPLSVITARLGDLEAAERYATEAVELSTGSGWQASALAFYSEILAARGDLAGADAAASRALRAARDAGHETWFRIALRDMAVVAAARQRWEHAAVLLGASRRNMPAYGMDASISGPIEAGCRDSLGDVRFDDCVARGQAMSYDDLEDLTSPIAP